jgi:hypothetical protein
MEPKSRCKIIGGIAGRITLAFIPNGLWSIENRCVTGSIPVSGTIAFQ